MDKLLINSVTFIKIEFSDVDETNSVSSTASTENTLNFQVFQQLVCGILLIVIMLISIPGNLILCLMVYRHRRMNTGVNVLLVNIAMSDLLLSIFVMPFDFITLVTSKWVVGNCMCQFDAFLANVFLINSATLVAVISVDRFLIIVYRIETLSVFNSRIIVSVTWIYSCLLSAMPLFGWSEYEFQTGFTHCTLNQASDVASLVYNILHFFAILLLPLLVMIVCYISIMNTVRHNSIRINPYRNPAIHIPYGQNEASFQDVSLKTKNILTVFLMFLVFICCRAPYCVAAFVRSINKDSAIDHSSVGSVFLLWWCYLSQALNAIIYYYRIKYYRELVSDLKSKVKGRICCLRIFPCGKKTEQVTSPITQEENNNIDGITHM